jgi:hypothetical protein
MRVLQFVPLLAPQWLTHRCHTRARGVTLRAHGLFKNERYLTLSFSVLGGLTCPLLHPTVFQPATCETPWEQVYINLSRARSAAEFSD